MPNPLKFIDIPICRFFIIILSVSLLLFDINASAQNAGNKLKLSTVVIDAGHGGKDPGSVSKDRKTYEKTITLSIAKLFGEKIKEAYPDVKVIYTRTTDKYLTLNERADIANRNNANLFVSIHINATDSPSPYGFSTHILGQSRDKNRDLFSYNMDICKRENSVILLEEDYGTKYQGFNPTDPESFIFFNLMQNAYYEQSLNFAAGVDAKMKKGPLTKSRGISQDPFYLLWKTTMPAVLVEAGFISNPNDLKTLRSETGREGIAGRLFEAFREFKKEYDGSLDFTGEAAPAGAKAGENAVKPIEAVSSGNGVSYGVQILVLSNLLQEKDKAFKGYAPLAYKSGNVYKYVVGDFDDVRLAKEFHESVKKRFPDSFIVFVKDGEVSRYREK
ncbi:MAG: N-acetylmuramoyl-L-alanine amidase [Candidatus Cryptobacteroides sp.]